MSNGLSPFVRGTTDERVFFLQSNARRLVPDKATLELILAGQSVRMLSDAELAAIPEGMPLPSRQDGTLMSVQTSIFTPTKGVYCMSGGLRRRVPDNETLTSIITCGMSVPSVNPADPAAIPQGPALPTRSGG